MTNDEAMAYRIERECNSGDIEADHAKADRLLLELLANLGYLKTIEAFRKVEKWYA